MSHVKCHFFLFFSLFFFGGGEVVKLDGGGSVINGANTVLIHKGKNLLVFGHYPKKGKWREWGVSNPNIKICNFFPFLELWHFPGGGSGGTLRRLYCFNSTNWNFEGKTSENKCFSFLLDIVQKWPCPPPLLHVGEQWGNFCIGSLWTTVR